MDVLKFGGSSVGSRVPLLNLRDIVSSRTNDTVVIVSALGGVTDLLLKTAELASVGDAGYRSCLDAIMERHVSLIGEVFTSPEPVVAAITPLLDELRAVCNAIFSESSGSKVASRDLVASFGERLSSVIVSELIGGSILYDALTFVKTVKKGGKSVLDSTLTERMTASAFRNHKGVGITQGFIARDYWSGEITTLGRGGSDYTASIIAAAVDADLFEIWTDVDGFMTADPRIFNNAEVIDEMSFSEAVELCNAGAKVLYAPALYPVSVKGIPIHIRNTFNPSAKGTVIRGK